MLIMQMKGKHNTAILIVVWILVDVYLYENVASQCGVYGDYLCRYFKFN